MRRFFFHACMENTSHETLRARGVLACLLASFLPCVRPVLVSFFFFVFLSCWAVGGGGFRERDRALYEACGGLGGAWRRGFEGGGLYDCKCVYTHDVWSL